MTGGDDSPADSRPESTSGESDSADEDADLPSEGADPASEEFLAFLDELRIMAQVGLEHADDPYDERRYERILELSSAWYGEAFELPSEEVRERFAEEVGYVTPKVSADAVVFDDEGRALLQRRADDGSWCLPGGYVEPNETPAETAVREAREETGLTVEVVDLVGIYPRKPGEYGPHGLIEHDYLCRPTGGELSLSREGDELRYWDVAAVPEWHKNHEAVARDAREMWERGLEDADRR